MSDYLDAPIQRCPHDKENPYAQISRNLIRDKNISPECCMILIYLLSHTENWQLSPKQLYSHFGEHMGINKIYKLIGEAIAAGYIFREDIKINNLRKKCKYFVSETPKFKKYLRRDDFGDREERDHENRDITKEHNPDSQEITSLKEPPPLTPTPIPIKEKTKEDWWRGSFQNITSREHFDSAWQEYLEQPLSNVKHIKAWLIAVIQRKLTEGRLETEKEQMIDRHRNEANLNDNFGCENTISAYEEYVEIVRGNMVDHIPYNLNDEDWKKATDKYFK